MRKSLLKMEQLLQNAAILLQNATVIRKCDVYYKMRWYSLKVKFPNKR